MGSSIFNLQLQLLQNNTIGREQFDIKHLARCWCMRNGIYHRSREPDNITLKVGRIVKMQIYLLLRTYMAELVNILHIRQ